PAKQAARHVHVIFLGVPLGGFSRDFGADDADDARRAGGFAEIAADAFFGSVVVAQQAEHAAIIVRKDPLFVRVLHRDRLVVEQMRHRRLHADEDFVKGNGLQPDDEFLHVEHLSLRKQIRGDRRDHDVSQRDRQHDFPAELHQLVITQTGQGCTEPKKQEEKGIHLYREPGDVFGPGDALEAEVSQNRPWVGGVPATQDTSTMLAYSAMKKKAKRMPLYSVKKPATSSLSASGKSKGTRFVSATAELTYTTKAKIWGAGRANTNQCQNPPDCASVILTRLSEPERIRTPTMARPTLSS